MNNNGKNNGRSRYNVRTQYGMHNKQVNISMTDNNNKENKKNQMNKKWKIDRLCVFWDKGLLYA